MDPNDPIRDRRIAAVNPLLSPIRLISELPLSKANKQAVISGRDAVVAILDGRDDRLLVIVGPCSVHDPVAALEYARRLKDIADDSVDHLLIVMRVYFEKPRTAHGWKGLMNDPGLDSTYRVNDGLIAARSLLLRILSLGIPIACEFVDPITPQYIADAVSWGAIGARTSESPIHRQLASGLSMPVGFKNATNGDVRGAVNAVAVAARSQVFPSVTLDGDAALFTTRGNQDCHVVLRGGTLGPNYDEQSVKDALDLLTRLELSRRVIVDASHDNSGGDHLRQPDVAMNVANRIARGDRGVVGMMFESFLLPGRQNLKLGHASELVYGQSITDSCMGWESTVTVLKTLAEAIASRRTLFSSEA